MVKVLLWKLEMCSCVCVKTWHWNHSLSCAFIFSNKRHLQLSSLFFFFSLSIIKNDGYLNKSLEIVPYKQKSSCSYTSRDRAISAKEVPGGNGCFSPCFLHPASMYSTDRIITSSSWPFKTERQLMPLFSNLALGSYTFAPNFCVFHFQCSILFVIFGNPSHICANRVFIGKKINK